MAMMAIVMTMMMAEACHHHCDGGDHDGHCDDHDVNYHDGGGAF